MTLPSGTISMSQVNVELNRSPTATISMDDVMVRDLATQFSGSIGMSNLRSKRAAFRFTISTNQTDLNLRALARAAGWNEIFAVEATIAAGVSINGSVAANSTAALTIDGSWPNGVTLINNGSILGRGGAGGNSRVAGTAGGRAMLVSVPCSINNIGTIAGGGGGGGGGYSYGGTGNCDMGETTSTGSSGAGGGGGGRSSVGFNAAGGFGDSATCGNLTIAVGGTGGTGTSTGPGSGGTGRSNGSCGCPSTSFLTGGNGGAGGAYGTAGTTGGGTVAGGAGGAGGQAVSGNLNITWLAFGTRLGAIV